jgi:hypothetical protein
VPAPVIVQLLDLSEAQAAQVIEACERIGGFVSSTGIDGIPGAVARTPPIGDGMTTALKAASLQPC